MIRASFSDEICEVEIGIENNDDRENTFFPHTTTKRWRKKLSLSRSFFLIL